MGGFGSGRSGGRDKAEHSRSLDVNRLHRAGCLKPGYWGGWEWKRDGERVAWINMHTDDDGRLHLAYRFRANGDDWQDVRELVRIERVPCRYGGTRPYFICPGVVNGRVCGRRVVKLYGAARYFLCRHCYRLAYASQSESDYDRLLRRRNKARERIDGEFGPPWPTPKRPKGMWQRTYRRRLDKTWELEMQADAALAHFLERFTMRGRWR